MIDSTMQSCSTKCAPRQDRRAALSTFILIAVAACFPIAHALCQDLGLVAPAKSAASEKLQWRDLPALPDPLGLAGPVVGVHNGLFVVGGGANFALPVWENEKQWHSQLFALDLEHNKSDWRRLGHLPHARAYCACASTPHGIAMIGGNDAQSVSRECWLLRINAADRERERGRAKNSAVLANEKSFELERLPDLPHPSVYAQAAWFDGYIVVCCGQSGTELSSATAACWKLRFYPKLIGADTIKDNAATKDQPTASAARVSFADHWEPLPDCPGGARSFAIVTATSDPNARALWLIGGRRDNAGITEFLNDVWKFDALTNSWSECAPLPVPLAAGTGGPIDRKTIALLSGDDGKYFAQTDELRDEHPGFPLNTWLYDIELNLWRAGGRPPANQVTTAAVALPDRLLLASGEIRPRVRTPCVWEIKFAADAAE